MRPGLKRGHVRERADETLDGADDAGESNLKYKWAVKTMPAGAAAPTFSVNGTNAAKNSTATFYAAGNYTFQVQVTELETEVGRPLSTGT